MPNVVVTHRWTWTAALALLVIVICFPQASRAQGGFPAFKADDDAAPTVIVQPPSQSKFPSSGSGTSSSSSSTSGSGSGFATPGKFPGPPAGGSFPIEQVTEQKVPVPFSAGNKFPTGDETELAAEPVARGQKTARAMFPTEPAVTGDATLTLESLGQLLDQIAQNPTMFQRRHDFLYRVDLVDQEMELFFSTYLTVDNSQLRIRAWLDPLPSDKVPSEPLLKLLARNIEMRTGMHFGYSVEAKRFLIEAVLENEAVTAAQTRVTLDHISREVADTWALWSTTEWTPASAPRRVAEKPELDSRALSSDQFEMPLRR